MAVRRGGATDSIARIEKIISYQAKQIRTVFISAVQQIKDAKTLKELATLLENGQFDVALESVATAAESIGNSYGASLSDAARKTATWLSTSALTVTVSFDQTNTRAVAMMQANKLRLVREFTAEQIRASRQALLRGIEEGLNPVEQARAFRASIGLTAKQEAAVANYKSLLKLVGSSKASARAAISRALRDGRYDRTVLAAARDGIPLEASQIERMAERYRERMVKYRSETIARTEAMRSVNQGNAEMYQQAVNSGALNKDEIKRKWVSAKDERVRASHARLHGTIRGMDEVWLGDDGPLRYPGDPDAPASETIRCRCCVTTRLEPQA